MKVGDIIQNKTTKEFGVIVEKPLPQHKQAPFVYVLNMFGQVIRWRENHCGVINEK
jgi:hypothetical protein